MRESRRRRRLCAGVAFETDTFGVMVMCHAFTSRFRECRAGVIVNVTSTTLAPFPLVAAYTASKTAVKGFTASLQRELQAFDMRVRLVESGYGPSTRFAANGQQRMQGLITEPYASVARRVFEDLDHPLVATTDADVAEGVWQAASDPSDRLHFPAGADAVALAARRVSP